MILFSSQFERFWDVYPKKRAKKDALKAWEQLSPSQNLVERMIQALDWQKKQDDWLRDGGQYIPFPATWIRGMRWEDAPTEIPRMSKRTMQAARALEAFLADHD